MRERAWRTWKRIVLLSGLGLSVAAIAVMPSEVRIPPAEAQAGTPATTSVIVGQVAQPLTPEVVSVQALSASAPTAAQMKASQEFMARRDAAWRARRESTPPASDAGVPGGVAAPVGPTGGNGPSPAVPGTLKVYRGTIVTTYQAFSRSNIAEPSVAPAGKTNFITWNWGAGRSYDGGASWTGVDPYAGWTSPYSFCCDQDTVYDRGRDMMLWYRQGNYAATPGQNQVKLARSNDGGITWAVYTIQPNTLSTGFTNQWFDYPHLALSNDYLYITTNMFSAAGAFQRMVLMRISLDQLKAASTIGITYWTRTTGWSWAPVQGAREVMYLGDTTNSAGTFSVFTQKEADTLLTQVDKAIPAWTFTNGNATCTVLGGTSPCLRADQRITAGVVTNNSGAPGSLTSGAITFFWNVKQDAVSYAKPYVNAASFNESTKAYIGRPNIWNPTYAWQYAAAGTNERGDIGITLYLFGSAIRPYVYAGIDDDYNGNPPGWEVTAIAASAGNPSGNTWGDYSRVRPNYPCGTGFTASVYTKDVNNVSEIRFVQFGRERDAYCNYRWYNK